MRVQTAVYEDTDERSNGMQAPQQEVAFRGSVKPLRAVPVVRRNVARAASCSAEERAPLQLGKAVAAAALAAAMTFGSVDAAKADISGLTPCSESKQFAKRQKNEVKALTKRLGKVSIDIIFPSACMHASPIVPMLAISGPELALKASDAVAGPSVMHQSVCMVHTSACNCMVVFNLIFNNAMSDTGV